MLMCRHLLLVQKWQVFVYVIQKVRQVSTFNRTRSGYWVRYAFDPPPGIRSSHLVHRIKLPGIIRKMGVGCVCVS